MARIIESGEGYHHDGERQKARNEALHKDTLGRGNTLCEICQDQEVGAGRKLAGNRGSNNGPQDLRDDKQTALAPWHGTDQHDSEGDGGVEETS